MQKKLCRVTCADNIVHAWDGGYSLTRHDGFPLFSIQALNVISSSANGFWRKYVNTEKDTAAEGGGVSGSDPNLICGCCIHLTKIPVSPAGSFQSQPCHLAPSSVTQLEAPTHESWYLRMDESRQSNPLQPDATNSLDGLVGTCISYREVRLSPRHFADDNRFWKILNGGRDRRGGGGGVLS